MKGIHYAFILSGVFLFRLAIAHMEAALTCQLCSAAIWCYLEHLCTSAVQWPDLLYTVTAAVIITAYTTSTAIMLGQD